MHACLVVLLGGLPLNGQTMDGTVGERTDYWQRALRIRRILFSICRTSQEMLQLAVRRTDTCVMLPGVDL